jgi:protein O-GlcNAc transferase
MQHPANAGTPRYTTSAGYVNGSAVPSSGMEYANMTYQQTPVSTFRPLPPQPLEPGQQVQTATQVQAILSLPPDLLAQLARTADLGEQKRTLEKQRAGAYMPTLLLHPPTPQYPPTAMPPHVPQILQQVWGPLTAGIVAPSTETPPTGSGQLQGPFKAIYTTGSLDDWARNTAASQFDTRRLNDDEMRSISENLKTWAEQQQQAAVYSGVVKAREAAVYLAASARAVEESRGVPAPDISAYREVYKQELTSLATDYYAPLHQEAFAKLWRDSGLANSQDPTRLRALLVQASAVAAIAATFIAAKSMAEAAGEQLTNLGVDAAEVAPLVSQSSPLATSGVPQQQPISHAFTSARVEPQPGLHHTQNLLLQQHFSQTSHSFPQSQAGLHSQASPRRAPPQVQALIGDAMSQQRCSIEARDFLLNYAHTLYTTNHDNEQLLPLLQTLDRCHPNHPPTLLLLSCVHYSLGTRTDPPNEQELQMSYFYNHRILDNDPGYVRSASLF